MADEVPTAGEGASEQPESPTPSRKGRGSRPCDPSVRLKPKHERFVAEFLVDWNYTQAAIRAGYPVSNAADTGRKLARIRTVAAAIREKTTAMTTRLQITADEVLRELWLIAKSNIADYRVNEKGELLLASPLTDPGVVRSVQSVKHRTRVIRRYVEKGVTTEIVEYETEIKLYDKLRALITAAQYLGILKCPAPAKEADVINELLEILDRSSPDLAAEIRRSLNSAAAGRGVDGGGHVGDQQQSDGSGSVPE